MKTLSEVLAASAALHPRLCPRQVLGARIGLLAGTLFGLDLPQPGKRLLAIVETDSCFSDGVAVATNCWVGRRTMRVEDYGKTAATFVDSHTGQALRIVPRHQARQLARACVPEACSSWEAYLLGYQQMPAAELLSAETVQLRRPLDEILSKPGTKAVCESCAEEILNGREIVRNGVTLCRACAGDAYFCS